MPFPFMITASYGIDTVKVGHANWLKVFSFVMIQKRPICIQLFPMAIVKTFLSLGNGKPIAMAIPVYIGTEQNVRYFAGVIFKYIFLSERLYIWINI